jgi:hypothetical protein
LTGFVVGRFESEEKGIGVTSDMVKELKEVVCPEKKTNPKVVCPEKKTNPNSLWPVFPTCTELVVPALNWVGSGPPRRVLKDFW